MHVTTPEPGQLVALTGALGVRSVPDVRSALHAAVDTGTGDLVVDVGRAEIVDATGLGVLVGAHRRAGRAGRRVVLRSVPPRTLRLLRASRLDRVLSIEATAPPAVGSVA